MNTTTDSNFVDNYLLATIVLGGVFSVILVLFCIFIMNKCGEKHDEKTNSEPELVYNTLIEEE